MRTQDPPCRAAQGHQECFLTAELCHVEAFEKKGHMTRVKTGNECSRIQKPTLTLRLATQPGDQEAIAQLCSVHDGPSRYPIKFRRSAMVGDEVLMAFLPDGQLAASVRMNIVTTTESAKDQLGAFVQIAHLPALILERSCALSGEKAFETLRMIVLRLANDLCVGKEPVMSQIDSGLPTESTLSTLQQLGYGDLPGLDSNGFTLPALPKARFKQVAQALRDLQAHFGLTLGQHGEELLAAEAPHRVVRAHADLDAMRGFAQHDVASSVSEGVVDGFEMVEIRH